jgi:protein ImuA
MSAAQASDVTSLSLLAGDPGGGRLTALRRAIGAMEPAAGAAGDGGAVPVGPAPIDGVLGGGLTLGCLHEIAAPREAAVAAATAFALALAARGPERAVVWVAEDFGLAESGVPYGPGLDDLGLAPERLVTVAAAKARDVLWVMEEALGCGGIGAVIGEIRGSRGIDLTASRRLSLAAGRRLNLALLLRTEPGAEASAAVTRWIVGPAPSVAPGRATGPPRLALTLARNRRGQLGSWTVEWNHVERRFDLAPAHREPVAEAAVDRPHRAARA